MDMLKRSVAAMGVILLLCAGMRYGVCENEGNEVKIVASEDDTSAVSIHNTTCPVSEDEIDKATAIMVEYKGKIYNLCCAACVKHFKKYPDKFAYIMTKQ